MQPENDRKIIDRINHKIWPARRGVIIAVFIVFVYLKPIILLFTVLPHFRLEPVFMNIFFIWRYVLFAPVLVLVLFATNDPQTYRHPLNKILLGVFTVLAGLWLFFEGNPVLLDYYGYLTGNKSIKTVIVESYKNDSVMPGKLTVRGEDNGYNIPFMLGGAPMQGEEVRILYFEKSRMILEVLPAQKTKQ